MKKGFTLIEMAVVLLIIGVLAGIVLRNIGGQSIQARDAKRVGDLRNLTNYLAQYLAKQGQFPSSVDSSLNGWPNLTASFTTSGMSVLNLPTHPAGDPYYYNPCSDVGNLTSPNHFILRATLEQSPTSAPTIYADSYDNGSLPTGWTCASSTFSCSRNSRNYCITQ